MKFNSDLTNISVDSLNEVSASVTKNPLITWAKFILTDDKPNENNVIVPQSEFDNIITSGIHMPIKMAYENIEDDHEKAFAIGVITNLKKVKNQIVGLAAFWNKERGDDIKMLKDKFKSDEQIDLSWEIVCHENKMEDGSTEVENATLKAATIVGLPAYAGRTPILQMASKEQEDKILDELKELKDKLDLVVIERNEIKLELSEIKSSVEDLDKLNDELELLRSYKKDVEATKERVEKESTIKERFVEAGIDKDEDYFSDNLDRLLGFSDEDFNFFLQELVAFVPKEEKKASKKIPAFQLETDDEIDISDLASKLREANFKRE